MLDNHEKFYGIQETCRTWSQREFEKAPGFETRLPLRYAIPLLSERGKPVGKAKWLYPISSSSSIGTSTFK